MGAGRKKIEIKKIEKESSRMVTFSKRRKGLFKKAQEFHSLSGAKVSILVFSPAGNPYTYGDIATINAALNTFGNCTASNRTASNRLDLDDHQSAGTSTSTNISGLRQWLDSMNIESCDDVEQLVRWKEQLQEAKERIESVELLRSYLH